MSESQAAGEGTLTIDDSKVFVVTRAQRLRAATTAYLTGMRETAALNVGPDNNLTADVSLLDEILVWLGEMET